MPSFTLPAIDSGLLARTGLLLSLTAPFILPAVVQANQGGLYVSEANQERTAYAIQPLLSYSAIAEAAATERAAEMAASDTFVHDLQPLVERMNAAGVCYSGYGEIIAYNGKRDVAYTMDQWMRSDGHRKIILKSAYDQAAGSWADSPASGKRYHVMYFIDPCNTPSPMPGNTVPPTLSPPPTATATPVATRTPVATPIATATPSATAVPTQVSTPTPAPSATPTPRPTAMPTASPTATPAPVAIATPVPTPTPTPVPTPTPTPVPTPTPTPVPTPTPTPVPTPTPTATPVPTPTPTPTPTPVVDRIAPTIIRRSPAAAATGVWTKTRVSVTFSEAVRNVSGVSFQLRDGSSGRVVPSIVRLGSSTTATLSTRIRLLRNHRYHVVVTSGVTDLAGNRLGFTSWYFTTAK